MDKINHVMLHGKPVMILLFGPILRQSYRCQILQQVIIIIILKLLIKMIEIEIYSQASIMKLHYPITKLINQSMFFLFCNISI
jgi:hypothetical protein